MVAGREVTPGDAANTARLKKWWLTESGIPWGSPGDFDACVVKATQIFGEHGVHIDPKGWCANLHHEAIGIWPATHAKLDRGK